MALLFHILLLGFLQFIFRIAVVASNSINNTGSLEAENHVIKKRKTYEEVFDEKFEDYFHENKHTLIGSNIEIYSVTFENDMVTYTALHFQQETSNILEKFLDGLTSPEKKKTDSTPNVVYPKLSIFVDHNIYKKLGSDYQKVIEYVANFYTGVDLLYRPIQKPIIRLNIAKIFIATNRKATPFMATKLTETFTMEGTLHKMESYMLGDKVINYYSKKEERTIIIMMIMKKEADVLGVSFRNDPCGRGFVLICDYADYSGIVTAAHELGHVFGADHDEEDTHIMAERVPDESYDTSLLFSQKSQDAIAAAMTSKVHNYCFKDLPIIQHPFKLKLPGAVFDHKEQCVAVFGSRAAPDTSESGNQRCIKLSCLGNGSAQHRNYNPLDGTSCGTEGEEVKKVCLRGNCVANPDI